MIRLAFSDANRRTLGRGALVLAVILITGRGLPAWRKWRDRIQESAAREMNSLERARNLLQEQPALNDSLRARVARVHALHSWFLPDESSAAQEAALAALVAGAADTAHVTLGTLDVRTDSGTAAFAIVRVRGSAAGDIAGVMQFLALLEGYLPHLVVRSIELTQPDLGAPAEHAEALRLDFVVEALAAHSGSASGAQ